MANSKQIVYLSQAQYEELITNSSITVDGVTVNYDENDIYVTPQVEPVTDVRINGTSIAANGVADIPMATATTAGAIIVGDGLQKGSTKLLTNPASAAQIKAGIKPYEPIVPSSQHISTFYGLAKAAGHDEASSTEPLGTYTPEAKGAIQSMLGVSDLIATEENNLIASKAYAIGDVFTANGKLYKATAAIAADAAIITDGANANCEETSVGEGFPHDVQVNGTSIVSNGVANVPLASPGSFGLVKPSSTYGVNIVGSNFIGLVAATDTQIKAGTAVYATTLPNSQHKAVFYGLAKAAGDTTQSVSDNTVGTYTDEAKAAIRTMVGAVGNEDYATTSSYGIVKPGNGLLINSSKVLSIAGATAQQCKVRVGSTGYQPITVYTEDASAFYGLAYAAGDTTMSSSSNAVGTYTDNAKASIKAMLGIQDGSTGTVDVTGAAPTITAVENTRYVCGEVTSLTITPAASGICIIRFTSGSTPTLLTLPSTVKFPEWFDATTLETNTIYEICITDGVYGAVMSWAQ